MQYKRPPIGIMPQTIWKQIRWEELGRAIVRYIDAGCLVPTEWVEEYNRLDKEIKSLAIK